MQANSLQGGKVTDGHPKSFTPREGGRERDLKPVQDPEHTKSNPTIKGLRNDANLSRLPSWIWSRTCVCRGLKAQSRE